MRTTPSIGYRPSALTRAAFSLVEIIVTVGLLSFIILGLMAVFNQTQRAFRSSMTQTDLLEGARATMDLMARDLEEMTPSHQSMLINSNIWHSTNFLVELSDKFPLPFEQPLPGSAVPRTNIIQRFFFLTKENQDWLGVGYRVEPTFTNVGFGTLYRVIVTNVRSAPITLSGNYYNTPLSNFNRIAEGVVHLRVRAFATNGFPIFSDGTHTNAWFRTDPNNPVWSSVRDALTQPNVYFPDQLAATYFRGDAVPAYVELEIGFLEDRTLARLKSIPDANAQRAYLQNHAAQVHLFRQRIPIRNVDPSGY